MSLSLVRPSRDETRVVVEVPHAGLAVPDALRDDIVVPADTLLRDSDLYVDRLWADAPEHGATLLVATTSRYVVDLNRAEDDVDRDTVADHPAPRPTQARGVVWRTSTDGRPALKRPLTHRDLEARLEAYHRPYHRALAAEVARKRERFGSAVLLAAHSMPSARGSHLARADVVPGTRGGTSASHSLIAVVEKHFRDAGLSVRHDDPYKGGYTTAHYGRPLRDIHAIQIELNRALYANEATSEPDEKAIDELRRVLAALVTKLGAFR